jgi:hypothetical protein
MVDDDSDGPRAEELVAQGGKWSGTLFDNPRLSIAPLLFWTFTVDFEAIARSYGETPCSLTVDWVALPIGDWRAMPTATITCDVFAEPVESSVYFFEHYRFDQVAVQPLDQRGRRLHVAIDVAGDIDGLGLDGVTADAWLEFGGFTIALQDRPTTCDEAIARLAAFTAVGSLECNSEQPTHFTPSDD